MCYIFNSVCSCGLTDCQLEYDRTFEELIKDQLSTLPPVPYKEHNNQFVKAFTGCMKDKIIKNKYKPNECLVLSLNDCKTLFKEYFEEFLTFVDLKLIPEDTQQEMIDTFKTSFDFNCLVFAIFVSKKSLPILLSQIRTPSKRMST